MDEILFKVGDRLEASDYDKEMHGIEYVTVTEVNMESRVYHWEVAGHNDCFGMGTIHSGYFFDDARPHTGNKPRRPRRRKINTT